MGYRMIIADDEKLLIELIKQLGHFDELGIEIIDECYDGESAIESILEKRPDFVLSDIQMPVFDGLEMIERVRAKEPDILFILISGHRYFEYAQNALRLNVVDYLLKPVDEEQLNEIFKKVCKLVDQKQQQIQKMESLQKYQSAEISDKREIFWNKILSMDNRIPPSELQPRYLYEKYEIRIDKPLYQIAIISATLSNIMGAEESAYIDKIERLVENAFGEKINYFIWQRGTRQILLISYDEKSRKEVQSSMSAFFYSVRDLAEIYGEFRLIIGVSDEKGNLLHLQEAAGEAQDAIWGSLVFWGNHIIYYREIQSLPKFPVHELLDEKMLAQIGDNVRSLREKELSVIFSELFQKAKIYANCNPSSMRQAGLLLQKTIEEAVDSSTSEQLEEQTKGFVDNARNFPRIFENFHIFLKQYIRKRKQEQEQMIAKPVEIAVDYICKNYSKGISLDDAAKLAGVSSSHMSRIFKEEMGKGFNEYLTEIRLEESKRLLSKSVMNIREIAMAVGYQDERYFSKLFRKNIGIKPTEYRRLYR